MAPALDETAGCEKFSESWELEMDIPGCHELKDCYAVFHSGFVACFLFLLAGFGLD